MHVSRGFLRVLVATWFLVLTVSGGASHAHVLDSHFGGGVGVVVGAYVPPLEFAIAVQPYGSVPVPRVAHFGTDPILLNCVSVVDVGISGHVLRARGVGNSGSTYYLYGPSSGLSVVIRSSPDILFPCGAGNGSGFVAQGTFSFAG